MAADQLAARLLSLTMQLPAAAATQVLTPKPNSSTQEMVLAPTPCNGGHTWEARVFSLLCCTSRELKLPGLGLRYHPLIAKQLGARVPHPPPLIPGSPHPRQPTRLACLKILQPAFLPAHLEAA